MKIVVSSNCQTAGIAAALRSLTDADEVVAVPLQGEADEVFGHRLGAALAGASAMVFNTTNKVAASLAATLPASCRTLRIPIIHFAGFHPDICYAWHRDSRRLTQPNYNSALVAWAYGHRCDASFAANLFREEVFAALGYFDAHREATTALRQAFSGSDLHDRFGDFYLPLKRRGCFMHSMNHPRIDAICRLGQLVASALDLRIVRDVGAGEINDGLNSTVWPVYPPLADAMGVPGSYSWKFIGKQTFIDGIDAFVRDAYESYARQGIAPGELAIAYQSTDRLDHVLGAVAGKS